MPDLSKEGRKKRLIYPLPSVGAAIDAHSMETFYLLEDGIPDYRYPTYFTDCPGEWWMSLSAKDLMKIDRLAQRAGLAGWADEIEGLI